MTAPEAFRFTFESAPERHLRAAALLAPDAAGRRSDPAAHLPTVLATLMRDIGLPSGLAELGFGDGDVDDLVEGSLAQPRLLSISPREPAAEDLAGIIRPVDAPLVIADATSRTASGTGTGRRVAGRRTRARTAPPRTARPRRRRRPRART